MTGIPLDIIGSEINMLESELCELMHAGGYDNLYFGSKRVVRDSGWRIRLGANQKCQHETIKTLTTVYGEEFYNRLSNWKHASVFGLQMKEFRSGWGLIQRPDGLSESDMYIPSSQEEGQRWRAWVVHEDDPVRIFVCVFEQPLVMQRNKIGLLVDEYVKAILKYETPPFGEENFIILFDSPDTSYNYAPSVRWGENVYRK
jgi:hypothetical protein